MVQFGKELREKYFTFKKGFLPLNHGSFGMSPNPVFEKQREIQQDAHENQDLFYRFTLFDGYKVARAAVAEELDSDPNNVAFVPNATTGVNAVLRSYPLKEGDTVIYSSVIYGACKKTLLFMQNRYKIKLAEVDLTYPMTDDEIVNAFVEKIEAAGDSAKMCLFDVISSAPAWYLPWERLVEECRKRNVLSLVDGAHGYGIAPISLKTAKPDFFVTNVHKWGYISPACAAFYVDPKYQNKVHTMPISHSYQFDEVMDADSSNYLYSFSYRFTFAGTLDYSPLLSIPTATEFVKSIGGFDKVRSYMNSLAENASKLAVKKLGTEVMSSQKTNAMFNVRLPLDGVDEADLGKVTRFLQEYILLEKNCVIPVYSHGGKIWARLSAQIYLDMEDFERGFDYILEAIEHYKNTPKDQINYKSLLL
ncbi:hypothetical protein TRVA0_061S00562 [Trichomonascus vanleenenianus]|uniref:uncharacterized protein n=1 Tax=Trichomonascus vanleenenianus TaxID=2268995 RepID=UPI003ECB0A1A